MTEGEPRRAAERAAQRPFYLASSLLAYARAEGLDEAGLAAQAGCDLGSLPLLLLCRRPAGGGAVFRADVEAIAARFALDATRLARLLRRADAVTGLGRMPLDHDRALLTAARDRDVEEANPAAQVEARPSDTSTDGGAP